MQDKSLVIDQPKQSALSTTQCLDQSTSTKCHTSYWPVHGEHSRNTAAVTATGNCALMQNLPGNGNEPYGCVPLSDDDDTRKADQAHQDRVDDTAGGQVVAFCSGNDDDDDDDDDSRKRKIHNIECGGDESPTDQNDNDQDDEEHNDNRFFGEPVEVTGSDNPDDFPNIVLDDDMDIDGDDMVEVGIVDDTEEEDMVGLWEE